MCSIFLEKHLFFPKAKNSIIMWESLDLNDRPRDCQYFGSPSRCRDIVPHLVIAVDPCAATNGYGTYSNFGMPVTEQIARGRVERECYYQLLRCPLGCRIVSDVGMDDSPAIMTEYDKHMEHSKSGSQDGKEVHRRQALCMVAQEGSPGQGPGLHGVQQIL